MEDFKKYVTQLWIAADYNNKQRLQYMMFPDGIRYDKQKREVRTPRVNSVMQLISSLSRVTAENKKSHSTKSSLDAHWVAGTGIEQLGSI